MLKEKIKKILHIGMKIDEVNHDDSKYPKSLRDLLKSKPELGENHIVMKRRPDGREFYPAVKKIMDGWDLLNVELEKYGDDKVPEMSEYDCLDSGSPMKYRPFAGCTIPLRNFSLDRHVYEYPATSGSRDARIDFIEYLYREGFTKQKKDGYEGLSLQNVAFTCSTTHAFNMILDVIARPYDIILISGPNYGIFTLCPERNNLRVEIINLEEEDNFLINPTKLAKRIDELNDELKKEFKDSKLGYIPKVVAYLNLNPHNPIGNVMSKKDIKLIENFAQVCLDRGTFIIDDLIYRDLCFDQDNKAFPIASIPKYFNNTISLFGISKAYGVAGFRAGVIVCPAPIYWGIAARIFESMDSIPVPQVNALRGAFNGTNFRYRAYNHYFKPLMAEYLYRLDFTCALINGIDSVKETNRNKIIKDLKTIVKDEDKVNKLLKGIEGVDIRKGTFPQSGFFLVVDFTKLKGKYYRGEKINGEFDLLKIFYNRGKIKYLMGLNMSWPYEDEMVARTNFALELPALVNNYSIIGQVVEELTDEKV
jgi:aspartate/methionine/tyrosine aminotransferase